MKRTVKTVVHVSESELDVRGGMGRVAVHWKEAFERANIEFHHFGPARVGPGLHKALWHRAALGVVRRSGIRPDLVLAHEPVGEAMTRLGVRTVVFSHGFERRVNAAGVRYQTMPRDMLSRLRRRVADRFLWSWRRRQCDLGIRRCDLLLASNRTDADAAVMFYERKPKDVYVAPNGVDPVADLSIRSESRRNVLFYASWIKRKGTETLVDAIAELRKMGVAFKVIACTGSNAEVVLAGLPEVVKQSIEIVPRIERSGEDELFRRAGIFVLPSWAEGQPLTLLQALAYGRCCIASRVPGHIDLIEDGHTGFLFRPGDGVELARLVAKCLSSDELCDQIGRAAATSMGGRSWRTVADNVVLRVIEQ